MPKCTPQNITLRDEPELLAARAAKVEDGQLPGVHLEQHGQQVPGQRARRQYGASSSRTSRVTTCRKKRRTTATGSRRSPTSRSSSTRRSPPLNDVAVRKAISLRHRPAAVSQIGEYGYEPPANQTGIVAPTFSSWSGATAEGERHGYSYDPCEGGVDPQADGYKKGSDGIFVSQNGKKLAFYDHQQRRLLRLGRLAAGRPAGLKARHQGHRRQPSRQRLHDDLFNGKFQLAYYVETGGPSPYYEMRQWLYCRTRHRSASRPGRTRSVITTPAVDSLFNQYAATTSATKQHTIVISCSRSWSSRYRSSR